ncbi:MAG: methyltransferase domain-containing protein [Propylenella sp.]
MPIELVQLATPDNFSEDRYLAANPDVAAAVGGGRIGSGYDHFLTHGQKEHRRQFAPAPELEAARRRKRERLQSLLDFSMPHVEYGNVYDFLTEELGARAGVTETSNVSAHDYDPDLLAMLDRHADGIALDVGAGSRNTYFENVVNFEIVAYRSTDVLGVGEALPFRDSSFDVAISVAVLEHVRDPFRCASEIARVLKPGGELFCCVPFLQPLHGYPHHYYNMTHEGLLQLFEQEIEVVRHYVPASTSPIFSLSWILNSWARALPRDVRASFESMSVRDLMREPTELCTQPFCKALPESALFELASATVLQGMKKESRPVREGN